MITQLKTFLHDAPLSVTLSLIWVAMAVASVLCAFVTIIPWPVVIGVMLIAITAAAVSRLADWRDGDEY